MLINSLLSFVSKGSKLPFFFGLAPLCNNNIYFYRFDADSYNFVRTLNISSAFIGFDLDFNNSFRRAFFLNFFSVEKKIWFKLKKKYHSLYLFYTSYGKKLIKDVFIFDYFFFNKYEYIKLNRFLFFDKYADNVKNLFFSRNRWDKKITGEGCDTFISMYLSGLKNFYLSNKGNIIVIKDFDLGSYLFISSNEPVYFGFKDNIFKKLYLWKLKLFTFEQKKFFEWNFASNVKSFFIDIICLSIDKFVSWKLKNCKLIVVYWQLIFLFFLNYSIFFFYNEFIFWFIWKLLRFWGWSYFFFNLIKKILNIFVFSDLIFKFFAGKNKLFYFYNHFSNYVSIRKLKFNKIYFGFNNFFKIPLQIFDIAGIEQNNIKLKDNQLINFFLLFNRLIIYIYLKFYLNSGNYFFNFVSFFNLIIKLNSLDLPKLKLSFLNQVESFNLIVSGVKSKKYFLKKLKQRILICNNAKLTRLFSIFEFNLKIENKKLAEFLFNKIFFILNRLEYIRLKCNNNNNNVLLEEKKNDFITDDLTSILDSMMKPYTSTNVLSKIIINSRAIRKKK